MTFFSDLFGKGKRKKPGVPVPDLPSSPERKPPPKDGSELRLPLGQKPASVSAAPRSPSPADKADIPAERKDKTPWKAKKIPVWRQGDTILEHCDVEDVITTGGMGRIYVTNHRNWKVKVAIKSPTQEMLEEKGFFSRVQKEAEAWTELGLHPNIAYCYFVRNIEEVPHLFVEYVDGGNLRKWIEDGKCADLRVGLDLAIQFCHGMAHARHKGMIHRDIKPENILLTKDGILKITDFGIARWGVDSPEKGTIGEDNDGKTVGFIGTKGYASPEQWRDAHDVGPETDVFSFGLCLWEMLCGVKPYRVADEKVEIPDPGKLNPAFPESLCVLLKNLVAFEEGERRKLGGFSWLRERFKSIYEEMFHEPSPHSELETLDLEADGLNNQGVSYLELGKEEQAIRCWREALAKDPHHLGATFNLGYLEWQRAKITDDVLVTRMRELEVSKGNDPEYWLCLGWVHFERGDVEAVEKIQASEHRIEEENFFKALKDTNWHVLLRTFEGHTRSLNSVCFSSDGRYALSGGWDKTVRLWGIDMGRELRKFEGHALPVTSVCFSPDGRHILSASDDQTIRLWEINSGEEIRRFGCCNGYVKSACFSPEGRFIALGSSDKTVRLILADNGMEVLRLEGHSGWVRSVCLSPEGLFILSGSHDKTIRLWSVDTGKELRRFEGHTDYVLSVCFSPDGRYVLSGSSDNTVRLWEVDSGKELRRFEGHTVSVTSVCFSPDGRYVLSGSYDNTIRLWSVDTGKELRILTKNTSHVESVCFSSDGRYALSGSHDKTLRLWKVSLPAGDPVRILPFPFLSRVKPSSQLKAERNKASDLLRSAADLVGKKSFHEAQEFLREAQRIPGHARDPEIGALLTLCGIRGKGNRVGLKQGWFVRSFEGHFFSVCSVCFSPDGRYALSGSDDKTIRLWEVDSGKELRRFVGHTEYVTSVCFSPDGRYALSGSDDKSLRLWGVDGGKELRRFVGHTEYVTSVCFSPDGRYILSGSYDGTVRRWQIDNGKESQRFEGDVVAVFSVCFSSDSLYALSGNYDGTIRLWDVATGRELRRFEGHGDRVTSVCISPDGRYVLSGSHDRSLRYWELESAKELRRFYGHANPARTVCISPDGRYALSGSGPPLLLKESGDITIRLFEIASGKVLRQFEGHLEYVNSVCFSPDGRYALSGGGDGTLRLWEFDWEWEFA